MADEKKPENSEAQNLLDYLREAGRSGKEVDIDRLKVRLLIICSNKVAVENTANFLNRRGWQVAITTKVGQALKTITILKPDLVLLSVNVFSQKLDRLPGVIFNTFKTEVITFGERSDTLTLKNMQTIASNYKISGVVSGPNIQRRIKHILQEAYRPEAIDASVSTRELERSYRERGERSEGKREPGMRRFETDGESKDPGPNMIIAKGAPSKQKGGRSSYISSSGSGEGKRKRDSYFGRDDGNESSREENDDSIFSLQRRPGDGNAFEAQDFDAEPVSIQDFLDEDAAAHGDDTDDGQIEGFEYGKPRDEQAEEVRSEERLNEILKDIQDEHENSGVNEDGGSENDPADIEGIYPNSGRQLASQLDEVLYGGPTNLESALREAVIRAAQKRGEDFVPLVEATEGLAIPVLWNDRAGVLVVVQSGQATDRVTFENRLIEELRGLSARVKADVEIGKAVRMRFEKSEVFISQAEGIISFRLPNRSGEVSVTFSDTEETQTTISAGPTSDKARVPVADIVEDVPVGVNLYIHLPKNGRYVKLVRSEGSVSSDQKERLAAGKAGIYINKDEAEEFKQALSRNKAIARVKSLWKKPSKAS